MRNAERSSQLSFDALLADTTETNRQRQQDREYGHLPATMDGAVSFLKDLIARHHQGMLAGNAALVGSLREEAIKLATKLNNFEAGILADEDAPGCILDRLTRAEKGQDPLWGQSGSFIVTYKTIQIRIEMDGLYGIAASHMTWLGFGAHAVERNRPFLSDTGFRSFLGVGGPLVAGLTPRTFAEEIIGRYVTNELKGKLCRIRPISRCR